MVVLSAALVERDGHYLLYAIYRCLLYLVRLDLSGSQEQVLEHLWPIGLCNHWVVLRLLNQLQQAIKIAHTGTSHFLLQHLLHLVCLARLQLHLGLGIQILQTLSHERRVSDHALHFSQFIVSLLHLQIVTQNLQRLLVNLSKVHSRKLTVEKIL